MRFVAMMLKVRQCNKFRSVSQGLTYTWPELEAPIFNATMSNAAGSTINTQAIEDDEPDDWYEATRV